MSSENVMCVLLILQTAALVAVVVVQAASNRDATNKLAALHDARTIQPLLDRAPAPRERVVPEAMLRRIIAEAPEPQPSSGNGKGDPAWSENHLDDELKDQLRETEVT